MTVYDIDNEEYLGTEEEFLSEDDYEEFVELLFMSGLLARRS